MMSGRVNRVNYVGPTGGLLTPGDASLTSVWDALFTWWTLW